MIENPTIESRKCYQFVTLSRNARFLDVTLSRNATLTSITSVIYPHPKSKNNGKHGICVITAKRDQPFRV